MANDADDLERYRRDLMTPAERHAFEKKAMDDPFLRDALAGSETVSHENFSKDVGVLNSRLARPRTSWFTPIRIAAGVVLMASVGWLIYQSAPIAPESTADLKEDSTAVTDSTTKLLTLASPQKDSAASSDKKDPIKSIAAVKPSEPSQTLAQPAPSSTAGQSASGAASKVEPITPDVSKTELANTEAAKTEIAKEVVIEEARRDEEVQVSAPALQKKSTLAKPQMAERKADISRAVAEDKLDDNTSQKSEVFVFPSDSTGTNALLELATPAGGLEAYSRYLEKNQRVPDAARTSRVHGKVTVSFEVSATGNLSALHVIKSLGFGCDEELLRLVRGGPSWSPTLRNGKPQASTVWVKLEFAGDH